MSNRYSYSKALIALVCLLVLALTPALASAAPWPAATPHLQLTPKRVAGPNRYATAAAIAAETYPGWTGVSRVIIASGEDRAAADPLASSGLCWAYDAPLLLVSRSKLPAETRAALQQIASKNPTMTVTVVGGSTSVPSARIREIKAAIGSSRVEQPWPRGNRYAIASGIASRVRTVSAATSRTVPPVAIVANGEETPRFFDALAASAISRRVGVPILLTRGARVPGETATALRAAGNPETIVVGGVQSVSAKVYAALGGDARWAGTNRIGTAAVIARKGAERGWLDGSRAGVAAKLPDALAGAGLVGRAGGPLLLTGYTRMEKMSHDYLVAPVIPLNGCYVLGGPRSVSDAQVNEIGGAPAVPWFGDNTPAEYGGSTSRVAGGVGSNTTQVALYVNGSLTATRAVAPWGTYDLGSISVPAGGVNIEVRASNPDGMVTSVSRRCVRLKFAYPTMILIDKSQFKLYWVKNNELVKVYPIAIGKANSETPAPSTWKILAKYTPDPNGIYGPRKMRLFRKTGSRYVYTAYGIHGTNQPWVIGSKASHGCIRMYNKDILELYPQVKLGTMVVIRP